MMQLSRNTSSFRRSVTIWIYLFIFFFCFAPWRSKSRHYRQNGLMAAGARNLNSFTYYIIRSNVRRRVVSNEWKFSWRLDDDDGWYQFTLAVIHSAFIPNGEISGGTRTHDYSRSFVNFDSYYLQIWHPSYPAVYIHDEKEYKGKEKKNLVSCFISSCVNDLA